MAKRRNKRSDPSDELESAIEDTSEERQGRSRTSSSSRRMSKRRAERMVAAERARKVKMMKMGILITVVVAVIIVASVFGYLFLKTPTVIIETNHGDMEVELFFDRAPDTAGNFEKLMEEGFYDGLTFHRVIPEFMIQGGDPSGDGTGGPGYEIPDEESALALKHNYGVLSMANSGPDTGGSQFFIVVNPEGSHHLDGQHAVFGKVISGMDVAVKISEVPRDSNDKPLEPVVMEKVHYTAWYTNW
jgi:cyclophilin family peptidyl-prolyl cis-trans isomerase